MARGLTVFGASGAQEKPADSLLGRGRDDDLDKCRRFRAPGIRA